MRRALLRAPANCCTAELSGAVASKDASAMSTTAARLTRCRLPPLCATTATRSTAHTVAPTQKLARPDPRRRDDRGAPGDPGHDPISGLESLQRGLIGAVGDQLGRSPDQVSGPGAQFTASRRQLRVGVGRQPDGQARHQHPGDNQPDHQDDARGQVDEERGECRPHSDPERHKRWSEAANEDFLNAVDVGHEP